MEVWLHAFLTPALDGGVWSLLRPDCFTPAERELSTHWIGAQMGPRASLDMEQEQNNFPALLWIESQSPSL
jgi:hypothetical protein